MKKIVFFILFSNFCHAEYRVYQYYVSSLVKNLNPVPPLLVTSSLDPKSYVAYHGGMQSIKVTLLRSWMCLGNTAKEPTCSLTEGLELIEGRK